MKKLFFWISLLFQASLAMTQDAPIKDEKLRDLISKAVNNFPRLKEMEEQLHINDVKAEMLKANYQPTLGANIAYQYLNPLSEASFGGGKFRFQPYNNFNGALTLNQLIYDFGKTKLQLERNKSEQELTADHIFNSRNAVAYQVAQLYYGILFINKGIQVQENQLAALRENERMIQAKLKNGDALEYDLLTTQVRTANSGNRLNDLKNQREKNFLLLQWLTGSDERATLTGTDITDPLVLQTQAGEWKNNNPEARIINRKLVLYDYDLKAATINDRPVISSFISGGVRNGYQPDIEQFRLNGALGVGVGIPIFSASRPKLQRKLTEVNIETARKSLLSLEAEVNKDLATVNQDYQTLEQKLADTRVLVRQANKAYELAQARFKNGIITNVELLTIQNSVEDANLNVLQLQYYMLMDKLESHKVVGTKLF